jgi:hypothetical protein
MKLFAAALSHTAAHAERSSGWQRTRWLRFARHIRDATIPLASVLANSGQDKP